MNQMIEKLARAARSYRWSRICHGDPETGVRKYHVFGSDAVNWQDDTEALFDTEDEAQAYIDRMNVIALLTALREPSEEMVSDGLAATERAYREDIPKAFTAMIDSILPKGGEG